MSRQHSRFTDQNYGSSCHKYNKIHPCAILSVLDFDEILEVLSEELAANSLYRQTWTTAKGKLSQKKAKLPARFFSDEIPEEAYIAIVAYTMDTPLFSDFNKRYREMLTVNDWRRFPYKTLYCLLFLARFAVVNIPDPRSTLYRCLDVYRFDPAPKVGETFYFDSCASCSISEKEAEKFMYSGTGTKIVLETGAETAMGIAKYSVLEKEGEVLVFPMNRFRITKFVRGKHVDTLHLAYVDTHEPVYEMETYS